jgi:hypothetical protein
LQSHFNTPENATKATLNLFKEEKNNGVTTDETKDPNKVSIQGAIFVF